jgi:hypothetical protein
MDDLKSVHKNKRQKPYLKKGRWGSADGYFLADRRCTSAKPQAAAIEVQALKDILPRPE